LSFFVVTIGHGGSWNFESKVIGFAVSNLVESDHENGFPGVMV